MSYNFEKALEGGETEESIRSYLQSKGRSKEADDFFGAADSNVENMKDYMTGGSQNVGDTGFLERLKLSFGGTEAQAKKKDIEEKLGLRGKLDIGDLADIAGEIPSLAGGVMGGIFGNVFGGAVGVAGGELVKRGIGQALGVRGDVGLGQEIGETAKSGIYAYVGGKLFQKVGKYIANRMPPLLATLTGQNTDEITKILNNPKIADLGIQQGDDALRAMVDEGAKKSIQLKGDFIKAQADAVAKIAKQYPQPLLERNQFLDLFKSALRQENIRVSKVGNIMFSKEFLASDGGRYANSIAKVWNAARVKRGFDLNSIVDIKQVIGEAAGFPKAGGTSKIPALGRLYHQLDNMIKAKLPTNLAKQYGELNEAFSGNIKNYSDLAKAFNSADPFSKVAGVFANNKDSLRRLMIFYEQKTGQKITTVLAGRNIATERGSIPFGILNPRSWIDIVISPSMQAKGVSMIGKTLPAAKIISKYMRGLPPYIAGEKLKENF